MNNKSIQTTLKLTVLVIILNLTSTSGQNNYENYEGYKICEIQFQHEDQYTQFFENFPNLPDTLTTNRRKRENSMRVLIPPRYKLRVVNFLRNNKIHFQVINNNVGESIRYEQKLNEAKFSSNANGTINFESYQRFGVINNYMEYLKEQHPERVKIIDIGKSYEGRELRAILITNNTRIDKSVKPLILIDGGIHAREWISTATTLFAMQQLVENSSNYEQELEMYDWLIWPVVNPDGYEYTFNYDRLWRKNRRPSESANSTSNCVGTDLNRNFDFYWSYSGVSNNTCSEIYPGDKGFSEPESQALRDVLLTINATCNMYLTLHSYGNYLLYPWGYEKSLPSTWPYLDAVARAGARAIKKATGTLYTLGGAANVLYPASGGSDDYAFANAKIPIVICMELPSGGNGFDPPPDKILSIVAESWSGIRAMALEVHEYPLRNLSNCNTFSFMLIFFTFAYILNLF